MAKRINDALNMGFDTSAIPKSVKDDYTRMARILRVVDGDTVVFLSDEGDGEYQLGNLRLYGTDTPEKDGATKTAGKKATEFTRSKVENKYVRITTVKNNNSEKFGRFLAKVEYDEAGVLKDLSEELIKAGLAVRYMGDKKNQSSFVEKP